MKIPLLAILLSLLFTAVKAQGRITTADTVCSVKFKIALQYLNKKNQDYNPQKAALILKECASAGNSRAMNQLGILYHRGIGVDSSYSESLKWFEKSAALNNPSALDNVGRVYKMGFGVKPDFVKAYQYFQKSSELNNGQGMMHEGYMLLKGFGCEQDYVEGLELELKSAEKGCCHAMYLAAFCYRNGYGIPRDTAKGRSWLIKAVNAGCPHAKKALLNDPQNPFEKITPTFVTFDDEEDKTDIKYTRHNATPEELAGTYEGYVIRYDWSQSHVLNQKKLKIVLQNDGQNVTGKWFVNDSAMATIYAAFTDSSLLLKHLKILKNNNQFTFYRDNLAVIKADDNIMIGGFFQQYDPKIKEPLNPFFVSVLHKINVTKSAADSVVSRSIPYEISDVLVFPNPVNDILNIEFTLQTENDVTLEIIDNSGKLLLSKDFGHYPVGRNKLSTPVNLVSGTYIARIKAGKMITPTMIVKN